MKLIIYLKVNQCIIIKYIKTSFAFGLLYGPFFYGWCSTASRLEPLRGGLFTTNFPEIPGTHFINLRRIKG